MPGKIDELPWAAPPPETDDDGGGLFEVTLPGDGASSLGGALAPGRFARVLMTLFVNERTGRLAIETGVPGVPGAGPRGTLFFLHGEPVHAASVDADARLLARLKGMAELEDGAVVDPALPLVPLLVRKKWAKPTAILHALRGEVRDFLEGALDADMGVFRFFDDTEFADYVPLVGVNPFGIVIEHRRRSHTAEQLARLGEEIGGRYPSPLTGFANAAAKIASFTGGVDLDPIVNGQTVGHDVYEAARLDHMSGGLVLGALADTGLVELLPAPSESPVHDKRKALTNTLPLLVHTDGMTLVGGSLPGGNDLLSLYLLLKPERDADALLGVAKDASLLEVERGFRARMEALDPRGVAAGPARPHLLARMEEIRTKVERAFHSRVEATAKEGVVEYDLERKIGSGGMAEVWIAREAQRPDHVVAVKRIHDKYRADEKFARMFLREARLTRRIQHPNVVEIYSVGKAGDDLYLAMEYVDGADLAQLLRKSYGARRRVPIEVACKIIADVCGGMHAAHTAHDASGSVVPILHRDVSPQNILVSVNGDVKLTDFGVAKAIGSMTESMEKTGFVKGKVTYLAPELIDGFPASVRTDTYAASITLYGCLARLPFRKPDLLQTMRAIITEIIPPISIARPDAPKKLDEILARCTAKDPDARHPSAQALQLELEELLTHLPPADLGAWVRGLRDLPEPEGPNVPQLGARIVAAQAAQTGVAPPRESTSTTRVPIVEEVDVADL